ncbi:ATP-grasp domain-containing protein [Ruegeria arenilitoris]|uniref:ATP-grasp domain-containing protein n=1 Tax=Ruegeria arenilitoris TaxID=1173585 RepID=UPI0014811017|nr:ATP-grasp domain-containing protein [Ruegeria arenilitoris]
MQWILQQFEDTEKLAQALDRLDIPYTWHKVVPFVGDLQPEPVIENKDAVVLFGSYTLWRYAQREDLSPGVFKIRPFVHEEPWHPYLLNGADALFLSLRDIPNLLPKEDRQWFMRPVDDSKEEPGKVRRAADIVALAERVLALDEEEIPRGSLRHDTELMLTPPAHILKEWRIWIVNDVIRTFSLYKEGARVVYRPEIDQDAADFAEQMVRLNPRYARAYVMDICRTETGLKMLETNCINAAGFYAADLLKLADAIHHINGYKP